MRILVDLLFVFLSSVFQPETATCPKGWFAQGVRPSGHTTCVLWSSTDQKLLTLPMRVYCTGVKIPLIVDEGKITCVKRRVSKS